jgi:hypothetical protein
MLKREDSPGMSKLVRNSLLEGSAVVRSSSNLGSGAARFAFFLVRKRFILALYMLVAFVVRERLTLDLTSPIEDAMWFEVSHRIMKMNCREVMNKKWSIIPVRYCCATRQ